jgi:hypothetical protein
VEHFGGAVNGMRAGRKCIRLPILHGLKHTTNIMTESLCESSCILPGEESREIRWLRRITPDDLNGLLALKDSGDLIAGQENRDLARSGGQPFHELPLGMWVRSVDFI